LYDFNTQGIWWNIENKLICDKYNTNSFRDTLYVVKGGTIRQGEYTMAKNIPVPKYFFMALLRKRNDIQANGGYAAIGFWMEHKNNDDANYINYAKSIDQLEQLTGLDFFCNLPDDIE
jgi:endonuclease G